MKINLYCPKTSAGTDCDNVDTGTGPDGGDDSGARKVTDIVKKMKKIDFAAKNGGEA